jgi:aspartyl/glutamyl-tRNA(Asn/Gln) amidotransferase C subunit
MDITREHAAYIAKLAKLSFEDDELEAMALDMRSILTFAQEINDLDTSDTAPMEHVLPMHNVLRRDAAPLPFSREELLKNAPEQMDGCFAVPKVIE